MDNDTQFLDDFQKLIPRTDLLNSDFYSSNSDSKFHVIDDPDHPPVRIIVTTTPLSLEVNNPNHTKIHLLAIDKGLDAFLVGYKGKRPEGILLNQNDFCFIERKLEVTSESEITQTERIEEAIKKFDNFIPDIKQRFLTLKKDLLSLGFQKYEAYIVLPLSRYPRSPADRVNRSVAFWAQHKVALYETNAKLF